MTIRWVALAAVLMFVMGALVFASACDPCASCSGEGPTATPTQAANGCLPSSSIAVLVQGTNATVYAPQGNWGGGNVAVKVVPIETSGGIGTGGASTAIETAHVP